MKDFIVHLYEKRFGKPAPESVRSIEEIAAAKEVKKEAQRATKLAHSASGQPSSDNTVPEN